MSDTFSESRVEPHIESRARRWAREDANEAKERDVRALSVSMQENERDLLKHQRKEELRKRLFSQWDRLLESEQFGHFLVARGLCVRDALQVPFVARDAESAVLGAMLMDERAASDGVRLLHRSYFYAPRHGLIFCGIEQAWRQFRARYQAGAQPVAYDLVMVIESLRAGRVLEQCGGANYLAALIDSCPSAANVSAYCEAIVEAAAQRVLLAASEAIAEATRAVDGVRWSASACSTEPEPMHPPLRIVAALRQLCGAIEAMSASGGEAPEFKEILEKEYAEL